LFKIIAHEIPNILEGEDLEYFIRTREERINGPITKFQSTIFTSIKEFRKLISPIRKIIEKNGFISGKEPGVEDYIFFGNFKWVYSCSSCDLLDVNDPIFTWYKKMLRLTKL
jgi:glutathione S-transferase